MTLHDHNNRRRGADYQTFDDRLPTVKLNTAERANLWSLALRLFDDPTNDITEQLVHDIATTALGRQRADQYLAKLRGDAVPNFRDISRRENVLLLAAAYPHIPGQDEDEKADWVFRQIRPVFSADRWTLVVFPYILERVAEYKAAGGTLDRYPEVIEPPPIPVAEHVIGRITTWWGGVNMSGAWVDPEYQLEVSPDGRTWNDAPSSWRSGYAGPGGGEDAIATCCCAYQREDGTWVGGKYEWHVRPPRRRSLENIRAGYNGWIAPPSGTPIIFWAHTADGNRVSAEVHSVWP